MNIFENSENEQFERLKNLNQINSSFDYVEDLYCFKSFLMIQMSNQLNLIQRKFFNLALLMITQQGWGKENYSIEKNLFNQLIGCGKSRQNKIKINVILQELVTKNIQCLNHDYQTELNQLTFLENIEVKNKQIFFSMNPLLKKYLNLNLDSNLNSKNSKKEGGKNLHLGYTKLNLGIIQQLTSSHSVAIYEYLKYLSQLYKREINLDDLLNMFNHCKSYESFKRFNQSILKPSIQEINEKTDLLIQIEYVKKGTRVRKLRFNIQKNTENINIFLENFSFFKDFNLPIIKFREYQTKTNETAKENLLKIKNKKVKPNKQSIKEKVKEKITENLTLNLNSEIKKTENQTLNNINITKPNHLSVKNYFALRKFLKAKLNAFKQLKLLKKSFRQIIFDEKIFNLKAIKAAITKEIKLKYALIGQNLIRFGKKIMFLSGAKVNPKILLHDLAKNYTQDPFKVTKNKLSKQLLAVYKKRVQLGIYEDRFKLIENTIIKNQDEKEAFHKRLENDLKQSMRLDENHPMVKQAIARRQALIDAGKKTTQNNENSTNLIKITNKEHDTQDSALTLSPNQMTEKMQERLTILAKEHQLNIEINPEHLAKVLEKRKIMLDEQKAQREEVRKKFLNSEFEKSQTKQSKIVKRESEYQTFLQNQQTIKLDSVKNNEDKKDDLEDSFFENLQEKNTQAKEQVKSMLNEMMLVKPEFKQNKNNTYAFEKLLQAVQQPKKERFIKEKQTQIVTIIDNQLNTIIEENLQEFDQKQWLSKIPDFVKYSLAFGLNIKDAYSMYQKNKEIYEYAMQVIFNRYMQKPNQQKINLLTAIFKKECETNFKQSYGSTIVAKFTPEMIALEQEKTEALRQQQAKEKEILAYRRYMCSRIATMFTIELFLKSLTIEQLKTLYSKAIERRNIRFESLGNPVEIPDNLDANHSFYDDSGPIQIAIGCFLVSHETYLDFKEKCMQTNEIIKIITQEIVDYFNDEAQAKIIREQNLYKHQLTEHETKESSMDTVVEDFTGEFRLAIEQKLFAGFTTIQPKYN